MNRDPLDPGFFVIHWSRFEQRIMDKFKFQDADFLGGQRKTDFGKSRMRFFQIDASSNKESIKYRCKEQVQPFKSKFREG